MPVGIVVMRWDERTGTEVITKYPEEVNLTDKTLMQIYSTHEYSGEPGLISLMVGSLNIASYYTGPENSFYILLLLGLDDDPDAYEGGMADVARIILKAYEEDTHEQIISSAFHRLSMFPTLTEMQLLALTYQDEIKRMIITRLRDEGVVSKSELMVWLKDKYTRGSVDIDAVLIDLIKREIIKETSVKGMPSELIFLTNDLIIMRRPPIHLLKDPEAKGLPSQLFRDYQTSVKKFFQNYRPSDDDTMKIVEILTDPQAFEVLKLLKTSIVTRNELEKLKKKGVDDVDNTLKMLWEGQMIQVFQDEGGTEHYTLLSDVIVSLVFPKYLLNVIKKDYDNKSKADQVLIEYLNVLEETYLSMKSKIKSEED